GVNHLGHFALTGHLLPALAASDGEARVVTQSSGLHERGSMDFSDLHWERSYDKWDAYGRSKLANLLFAYELDRRLAANGIDDVTSVGCHPGYADTELQGRAAEHSNLPGYQYVMRLLNRVLAQSAADGALPMLYAATATDEVEGGDYVGPDGFGAMRGSPVVQPSSEDSYDESQGLRFGGCLSITPASCNPRLRT
ncbi:MAG: short-chain dehydrogenase, partial [Halobaculum sp.]